ncbi:hypothetical protein [Acidovorax sp.]|uniref:hypothetical protein n=1 Tax=Acidovorax sp. TaxID=1872122 RepID=UPI00391B8E5A
MTEETRKLIEQLTAVRFDYLPNMQTLAQRTGALGIVNLFALASHTLTAVTGTLAIVSIARLGTDGEWAGLGLRDQVRHLAELAVQVSASVERLIGLALVDLQRLHIDSPTAEERENIHELMTTGEIYRASLSTVSVETANMARRQGLWGRISRPACVQPALVEPCWELDQAQEDVRAVVAQIIELELALEQFGGGWAVE